jgi:CYTH domain-containing protein
MPKEIERKFLVVSDEFKKMSFNKTYLKQGYLNSDKNRAVRVRITEDSAFLTIKGKSSESGTTRFEWETKISREEALQLIELCEPGIIEKNRYYHRFGNHLFEVDEFLGIHQGLVLAEVELKDENEVFEKPNYLGKEVTGDERFYNSNLSKNSSKFWA